LGVAHIHVLGRDRPAEGPSGRDHLGRGRSVLAEEERHVSPFRGEKLDDGSPDAAASPRHDHRLAGQAGIGQHSYLT
jgi:hypothetical protein